jgi:osmoprotectant transport system substrate-binding protein
MNFNKNNKSVLFIITTLLLAFALAGCGSNEAEKIVVGGKDFTEQDVLVNLVSELIEAKTDYETDRKPYLGGSSVVATAIQSGDVDIMVDYTGTGLMSVLGMDAMDNPDEVYDVVKKEYDEQFGIKWLDPLGFNNTFAITMRRAMAEELGIEKLSDLPEHAPNFTFASTQEFLERVDGYDAIRPFYGFEFREAIGMDPGLCYTALKEEQVDISISYATDGRIPAFDFLVLEDDKNFFPPYDAAILVRNDTIEEYPGLEDALDTLSGKISAYDMATMNARVDLDKENPRLVAIDWLVENNIIEEE